MVEESQGSFQLYRGWEILQQGGDCQTYTHKTICMSPGGHDPTDRCVTSCETNLAIQY